MGGEGRESDFSSAAAESFSCVIISVVLACGSAVVFMMSCNLTFQKFIKLQTFCECNMIKYCNIIPPECVHREMTHI